MSVIDFLRRRPDDVSPDDLMARLLTDAFDRARPDPLFRRRLRSDVLNRYVAVREGLVARPAARHRSQMGVLGRSVLYASLALAGSAAGALAASQSALPGDTLYDVKLRLDELRMQAAPAHLRDDVALYILGQRLDETAILAADGDWKGAARAAAEAEESAVQLAAVIGDDTSDAQAHIARHLAVLERVLADAPPAAIDGLTDAIERSMQVGAPATPVGPAGPGQGGTGGPGQGSSGSAGGAGGSGGAGGAGGSGGSGGAGGAGGAGGSGGSSQGSQGSQGSPGGAAPTTRPDVTAAPAGSPSSAPSATPSPRPTPKAQATPKPQPTPPVEAPDKGGKPTPAATGG